MTQPIQSVSTEGRIYAQQVMREVKRREAIGAAAVKAKAKDWMDGGIHLYRCVERNDPFSLNALRQSEKRLRAIPKQDRGFDMASQMFALITLSAGGHTFVEIEDFEEGVLAQFHMFAGKDTCTGLVVVNISAHALGRLYERFEPKPTVQDGIDIILSLSAAGQTISRYPRLFQSEINLPLGHDVIATGSMKIGGYPGSDFASAFFDCRTVLPVDACSDEQLQQATALFDASSSGNGSYDMDPVPFISRRPDFVTETVDAMRNTKKN